MNIAVLQENLKAALATVQPAVASATTHPVLSYVKLVADDALTITATNLELGITTRCGAKVDAPGAVCVPAKLLADLVGNLPNDRIDLVLEKGAVRVRCGSHYSATLPVFDGDEFPTIPTVQLVADVPIELLRAAAARVAPMAAADFSRPVLAGVHLKLDTIARVEAADGFRSTRVEFELPGAVDPAIDIIVPARALVAVARAFKGVDDETAVRIGVARVGDDPLGPPAQLAFEADGVQIVSRLIDGKFPDLERVFPKAYTTRVIVEAREIERALKVAALYAAKSADVVKLEVQPPAGDLGYSRLTLSANGREIGESAVQLDVQASGQPITIAANIGYLRDAIAASTTPQIALETQNPLAPLVLRPVGADGVSLIMPMTVR